MTVATFFPVTVTLTGSNTFNVMLEMDLPENFIETGKPETIQIQVEGKCKISKFVFA